MTVASWLGVAGMAGACLPLARVFQSHVGQAADARQLAIALATFAPGLVGYGLTANLSRVLYADGRSRASAAGGQRRLAAGDRRRPADRAVRAAVARSCPGSAPGPPSGSPGPGWPCSCWSARFRGPGALRGCARAAAAGLAGALAGTAAGLGVAIGVPVSGFLPNVAVTLLASAAVLAAFLAVVALTDGGDLPSRSCAA